MKRVAIFVWGMVFYRQLTFIISNADRLNDMNFFSVAFSMAVIAATIVMAFVVAVVIVTETWDLFEEKK